jgi:hypothetical protein
MKLNDQECSKCHTKGYGDVLLNVRLFLFNCLNYGLKHLEMLNVLANSNSACSALRACSNSAIEEGDSFVYLRQIPLQLSTVKVSLF